ncbi:hypothetical protein B0T26DRAFT_748248 [Lasiosphaeria miniovina]|uniref:Uncharacterized protein n=1 Tax=Lasiosphaeria miniovina TaxID=1954250 RepID=A0AA40B5B7_9PEZI|nr:uncharacterized protein B0T26DRAFT_748248 [Lasiosphaeria miniovina]KAK0727965.1 hypothetical protein B0T26DRAFT_748248 [Lasiosphaeria miniovina]
MSACSRRLHDCSITTQRMVPREAALEGGGSGACGGNIGLRLGYLRFAARSSSSAAAKKELCDHGQAKAVFYRAIATCPWAKQLYLEAFEPPLAGAMATKGLRTHVDLEEVWDR